MSSGALGRGWMIRSYAPAVWQIGGSGSAFERCCFDDGEEVAASREQHSCNERHGEWGEGSAGLLYLSSITINI